MKKWTSPYHILATRNEHKLQLFDNILSSGLKVKVKGLNDLESMPEIVEDLDTFEGNAIKKAETIASIVNVPVVADDSGLVVPALGGRPGVHSARYAGVGATHEQNNQKLMREISSIPETNREAKFVTVMAVAVPGEEAKIVRGECEGVIISEPRGTGGFGYQPLFYLPSEQKTMAELTDERRSEIAHRALATRKVMDLLKESYIFE